MLPRLEIEDLFPITREYAYLDTAYRGPLCKPARLAAEQYLRAISERASLAIPEYIGKMHACLKRLADVFSARPEEFVFLANATDAFSRVTLGIDWREGDEVVAPANDYPGVLRPLTDLKRRWITLKLVELRDDAVFAQQLLAACTPRTRLIAASHVNFRTGFCLDVENLCGEARRRGILTAIDFVQSAGCLKLDFGALGVDFGSFAARKWFCALDTLGVFYVRAESLNKLTPHTLGLFSVAEPHNFDALEQPLAPGAKRFMLGAPGYAQIAAFDAALELYARLGAGAVEERVRAHGKAIREGAKAAKIGCVGEGWPANSQVPIVCLRREGKLAADSLAEHLLKQRIVASVRKGIIRVSPHWFTGESDISKVIGALK
jgi:selenocysteine lyase/cysteine desulfurase